VAADGDRKNECASEAPSDGVEKGTSVTVWTAFMLPQAEVSRDLMIQVKHGDVVRPTKDISIRGSLRYRTWRTFRLNKVGTWTFTILDGDRELQTLSVSVHE